MKSLIICVFSLVILVINCRVDGALCSREKEFLLSHKDFAASLEAIKPLIELYDDYLTQHEWLSKVHDILKVETIKERSFEDISTNCKIDIEVPSIPKFEPELVLYCDENSMQDVYKVIPGKRENSNELSKTLQNIKSKWDSINEEYSFNIALRGRLFINGLYEREHKTIIKRFDQWKDFTFGPTKLSELNSLVKYSYPVVHHRLERNLDEVLNCQADVIKVISEIKLEAKCVEKILSHGKTSKLFDVTFHFEQMTTKVNALNSTVEVIWKKLSDVLGLLQDLEAIRSNLLEKLPESMGEEATNN